MSKIWKEQRLVSHLSQKFPYDNIFAWQTGKNRSEVLKFYGSE